MATTAQILFLLTIVTTCMGNEVIKVMTFNTWYCGTRIFERVPIVSDRGAEKIGKMIAFQKPDVIALQETIPYPIRCGRFIADFATANGDVQYETCLEEEPIRTNRVAMVYNSKKFKISTRNRDALRVTGIPYMVDRQAICHLETIETGKQLTFVNIDALDVYYGPDSACRLEDAGVSRYRTLENIIDRREWHYRADPLRRVIDSLSSRKIGAAGNTVILTGDLVSPSSLDYVAGTAAKHCGLEGFSWPTTTVLDEKDFVDSYREVHPDIEAFPGTTYSTVFNRTTDGRPIPRERRDFIYYRKGDVDIKPINATVAQTNSECHSSTYTAHGHLPLWMERRCPDDAMISDHDPLIVDFEIITA